MRDGHRRRCCGLEKTSPPARGCEPGRAVMSRWRVGGSFAGCSMFSRFLVAVQRQTAACARFLCPLSLRSGPPCLAELGRSVPHFGQWQPPFTEFHIQFVRSQCYYPVKQRQKCSVTALVFFLGWIAPARQITKSEGSRLISIGHNTTVTCTFGAAGLVPSDPLKLCSYRLLVV